MKICQVPPEGIWLVTEYFPKDLTMKESPFEIMFSFDPVFTGSGPVKGVLPPSLAILSVFAFPSISLCAHLGHCDKTGQSSVLVGISIIPIKIKW